MIIKKLLTKLENPQYWNNWQKNVRNDKGIYKIKLQRWKNRIKLGDPKALKL